MEILIIDDDPEMRLLLTRILKGAGYAVHEARNGREGIALFHTTHPSLIITDIVMPEMEGIETIRALREASVAIPILAISGSSTPLYLRAAIGLGATVALAKPFRASELLSVVARLLDDAAIVPFAA